VAGAVAASAATAVCRKRAGPHRASRAATVSETSGMDSISAFMAAAWLKDGSSSSRRTPWRTCAEVRAAGSSARPMRVLLDARGGRKAPGSVEAEADLLGPPCEMLLVCTQGDAVERHAGPEGVPTASEDVPSPPPPGRSGTACAA
jgi:hypothetical protein